jgi:hypothetical protein
LRGWWSSGDLPPEIKQDVSMADLSYSSARLRCVSSNVVKETVFEYIPYRQEEQEKEKAVETRREKTRHNSTILPAG